MRLPVALAILILAVIATAPSAPGAEAHAALVRASPANNETLRRPPVRIVLNFSEPVERALTEIQVRNVDDERVDDGSTSFDDRDPAFASVGVQRLDPGLYFVRWTNVSRVDGHQLQGAYPFVVLNADGTFPEGVTLDTSAAQTGGGDLLPETSDAALKWIALLSLSIVAGAAFFVVAVLRPAAAFIDDESGRALVADAGDRWLTNLAHVLLPASFIASAFLVLVTVNRFGTDTGLLDYLTDVRAGQYRALLLGMIVVALAAADVVFLTHRRRLRDIGLGALIAACAVALLTYPLVSHSAAGAGKLWAVAADYAHVVAAAAWLGALAMLIPLLRWLRAALPETERFLLMANAFDRFAIVASLSVIVVLATGSFNSLVELPSWDALFDTAYGRVLLAKLSLVLPLLAVAGVNGFVLKPRLVRAIDAVYQRDAAGDGAAAPAIEQLRSWLPRTITLEVALVIAVFAAVAVLSQTATARGEIAQEQAASAGPQRFSQTSTAGGGEVTLDVTPNRVGINEYTLLIAGADGAPLDTVTQARLRFTFEDFAGVPTSELILNRFGPGDYRGSGAYFTQPGNWRVQASIRRSDGDDIVPAYVLPVLRPEAIARADGGDALDLPFTSLTWNEVLGATMVLCGVVLALYRRTLRWLPSRVRRTGVAAALALIVGGGVLAFSIDEHRAVLDPTAGNPVPPSAESVAQGRELFQQNCIVCHGVDGRGDGPQAASLNPAPTDFRQHVPLHTDPQFYRYIAEGYPGSAMPAFGETFSDEDIWNLVNFLRSAFTEEPTQ